MIVPDFGLIGVKSDANQTISRQQPAWCTTVESGRMEQAIYGLLANTLNPDPAVRTAAEKQLRENSTVPGFCSSLLQILTIPTVEPHVKQSGTTYCCALFILTYWRFFALAHTSCYLL